MQNLNEKPQITIQIVHAALIWGTLATLEGMAGFYLRLAEKTDWYYYLSLGMTTLVFAIISNLGKQPIVADIQEICFYDVLVQILGVTLYTPGHKSEIYLALAQVIIILKLIRLAWPFCSSKLMLPPYWPSFGLIGLLRQKRSAKAAIPYTLAQKRKFYVILACMLPIGYLIQLVWLKFNITLPAIVIVFTALWGVKRLIATLETREEEHRQTERNLGAAMGREQAKQEYIVELTAQKAEVERQAAELAAINLELDNKNTALATANAELDRNNATLQALYEERAAMAQDLAARNDRLADATHDIKTGMVPMAFKVNDLITTAPNATQRATAVWLQNEIKTMAAGLTQIVHQAKMLNPLPPLAPGQALAIHLLCEYFATRFNPMAVDYCIDLSCENKAGNQASLQTNEEEFKRIIGNLIINAIKYGKEDGKVRLVFYPAPDSYHVVVWDNGPGIPNLHSQDRADNFINLIEEQEKLQFERYQTDQGEPAPESGNGIGLINVKRLCKEVGIRIGMRSLVGRGTCFHLIVPISSILAK